MKRASYRAGVEWIAETDAAEERDPEDLLGRSSVLLLATLFAVLPARVVADVMRKRRRLDRQQERVDLLSMEMERDSLEQTGGDGW